jgi:hypothetical protein
MYGGLRAPDPSIVIPGKAACLVVAAAATALYLHGTGLGSAGRFVAQAQHRAEDAITGPQFGDASMALEHYHQLSGTYDGADVAGRRIRLVWANDASYCIEGMTESKGAEHSVGPYGRVALGPCPQWGF